MSALKKIATPLTIFASCVVLATGLWMYLFSKSHLLEEVHGQVGLLFALAVVLHLVINWKPFVFHLKRKAGYLTLIPVIAIASAVMIKEMGGDKNRQPSIPMMLRQLENAEIATLSKAFGIEETSVLGAMKADGLAIETGSTTLKSAAQANGKEPRDLFRYFAKAPVK
jgi:hypothetical protein